MYNLDVRGDWRRASRRVVVVVFHGPTWAARLYQTFEQNLQNLLEAPAARCAGSSSTSWLPS